jgi:teichoic acid transport system ATP-binding protein
MDVAELLAPQMDAIVQDTLPQKGRPTVIVDDVHLVYRVQGGGKRGGNRASTNTPATALKRMVTGNKQNRGLTEIHAVKGVTFTAHEGEAVGLIGSNGSGKSTLLRAIAGLMPVEKGAIYTAGQPSLLGANAVLLNDLSGEDNVVLGLLAMGMTKQEAKDKTAEIIEFSGINERGNFSALPMSTYSSGMAARLRFAIAAAKIHDVLLVDEALATGDAKFRKKSEQKVREMLSGAGTVFLVSHAIGTIVDTCDRTIWLESGVLRMDGPTKDVVAEYEAFVAR